jgi:glycosyltransferase involved in cell wall biosynthesis
VHVSIVTPAWNAGRYIGHALRSVLVQTHRDWSMIVVDDGSSDNTGDLVRACSDTRVRLETQSNKGVSAARNRGLELASGEAVLFLDADDELAPDALTLLVRALAGAPAAAASVGAYIRKDEDGIARCSRQIHPPTGDVLERLLIGNRFANGGHLLLRTDAVRRVGRFRTDLAFGEDWEYWVRLALLAPFVGVPSRRPVLFVRERMAGAYARRATAPETFATSLDAVFAIPGLAARFSKDQLEKLRRRADAEAAWIVGRELIRRGCHADGRRFLWRSVRSAPTAKRAGLLAASFAAPALPDGWRGPFRPYVTGVTPIPSTRR